MATALSSWTIDPVHSSVAFSLDYMGFSTLYARLVSRQLAGVAVQGVG